MWIFLIPRGTIPLTLAIPWLLMSSHQRVKFFIFAVKYLNIYWIDLEKKFVLTFMVSRGWIPFCSSDLLTFLLVHPWGWHLFWLICLNNYWMDYHHICCRHSWSHLDECPEPSGHSHMHCHCECVNMLMFAFCSKPKPGKSPQRPHTQFHIMY